MSDIERAMRASSAPQSDIDAFWDEAVRTVEEGDYDGYAALYHEDAVLVNGLAGTSVPIADALASHPLASTLRAGDT